MVKRMQTQLKSVSKALADLSKKVDKLNKQLGQVAAAKKPAKKAPAKKKAVKKAAPKKKVAKKAAPKKKAAKKAAPKKKAAKKSPTVLDSVYDVIKRSKKGVTIATLKSKTKLEARQLSNALYKLSKRGDIAAKSRGLYVKK